MKAVLLLPMLSLWTFTVCIRCFPKTNTVRQLVHRDVYSEGTMIHWWSVKNHMWVSGSCRYFPEPPDSSKNSPEFCQNNAGCWCYWRKLSATGDEGPRPQNGVKKHYQKPPTLQQHWNTENCKLVIPGNQAHGTDLNTACKSQCNTKTEATS